MIVETARLGKIGIDRIVLNNFQVDNFSGLEKKKIIKHGEIIERFEDNSKHYSLTYSIIKNDSGEYNIATLEFNPGKMKEGHNLYNASIRDLKISLDKIVKDLESKGVFINLEDAKIKELEINITLDTPFLELQEVIMLIGRANYQKALGLYSFNPENIPNKIRRDRNLYINTKNTNFVKENRGKVIKIYDKTFEMLLNQGIELDREVTRVEVLFGRDYYKYATEKRQLDNTLKVFLNVDIIKDLFQEAIKCEVKEKPFKELEKIKKNLSYEFKNFKRNEKVKREMREKIKAQNKEIPEHLKEERGIYKYLEQNSWIFDFRFLLEVTKENISSKHHKIYEKQILKKYINVKNYDIYIKFLNKIFDDFFLPTKTF